MTEAMKHRMVGLAVLVALGVILWPVLFDASPVREISQRSQIPPAPAVDRFAIEEPRQPDLPPEPDGVPGTQPDQPDGTAAAVATDAPDAATDAVEPEPETVEPAPSAVQPAASAPAGPATTTPAPVKPASQPAKPAALPAKPAATVPRTQQDKYGLPVQWAVQLGVFSRLDGAKDIKQRAEDRGYHAVMQSIPGKNGTQYRVVVGPRLDRKAAEQLQRDIRQKLGVDGYVTRFAP